MREWIAGAWIACLAGAWIACLSGAAAAQTSQGCFAGRDATGAPVRMLLAAERIGEIYTVYGELTGPAIGRMRLQADGWSGAGRLFRQHEGEAGALIVTLSDFTGGCIVLRVEGYGTFPFRAVPC